LLELLEGLGERVFAGLARIVLAARGVRIASTW
jgi:hypothetical protein